MARPRKIPTRSIAELEASIAEEVEQHALLQRDLRDALIAGEDTRPYPAHGERLRADVHCRARPGE